MPLVCFWATYNWTKLCICQNMENKILVECFVLHGFVYNRVKN